MMIIKLAEIKNLNNIMDMYSSCVQGMINLGIDQWDETYPNKEIIKKDINEKCFYVGLIKNNIIAGMRVDHEQDPSYLSIKWKDQSNKYMVVHRLGAHQKYWDKGVGKQMMMFAEEHASKKGCNSMRLDTYSNNPKAMNFYEKIGYKKLGHINLKPNKNIYYCYEKVF